MTLPVNTFEWVLTGALGASWVAIFVASIALRAIRRPTERQAKVLLLWITAWVAVLVAALIATVVYYAA